MKKKSKTRYENAPEEKIADYLKRIKKSAMQTAEEIFGDAASFQENRVEDNAKEPLEINETYTPQDEKPSAEMKNIDGNGSDMSEILMKLKKKARQTASDIFKAEYEKRKQ